MSREIKFRVFSEGAMHNVAQLEWHKDGMRAYLANTFGEPVLYCYPKHLMQNTGLKDKNGVEIYEGDIVRRRTSDERMEQFAVKYRAPTFNIGDFDPSYGYTVIGNIYENADILN